MRKRSAPGAPGENTVLVGGMPVGIYMETDGILVLDTQEIEGEDGEKYGTRETPCTCRRLHCRDQ